MVVRQTPMVVRQTPMVVRQTPMVAADADGWGAVDATEDEAPGEQAVVSTAMTTRRAPKPPFLRGGNGIGSK